jgi:hypothetical protein
MGRPQFDLNVTAEERPDLEVNASCAVFRMDWYAALR